jgi:hypothetical protein
VGVTATDALGRPLNPDTDLPYPSASAAQEQLADELLARLLVDSDNRTPSVEELRDALVEAVVRQHGRTLRACLDELRSQADGLDLDGRRIAQDALDDSTTPGRDLREAARYTDAASALRRVVLGGWRA